MALDIFSQKSGNLKLQACRESLPPCALSGATAFFADIPDISIVIHGPSGCFFYPSTVLHREVFTTGIIESDAIFGTYERLDEIIRSIRKKGHKDIAVITSCVTSVTGEDYSPITDYEGVILIDSPGFLGGPAIGYKRAMDALEPACDESKIAMNVDGICKLDPFNKGNFFEARRLFNISGIPHGSFIAFDTLANIKSPSNYTLTLNPLYESGLGAQCGTLLGLDEIGQFAKKIEEIWPNCRTEEIFIELDKTEEIISYACEKYLKRNDPPSIAVFCDHGYYEYIVKTMKNYLDAELINVKKEESDQFNIYEPSPSQNFAVFEVITESKPDLVFGSSFEKVISNKPAFIGVSYPLRDKVSLSSKPLLGTEGLLHLVEDTLNALRDRSLSHCTE